MTEDGTEAAAALLLCRATAAPPVGAGPVSVTVPVEFVPPTTEVGFSDSAESVAGLTVSVAPACMPLNVPEMFTVLVAATAEVVTVNVAVTLPAATIALAGTCATLVLLVDIATARPPAGAAPLKVTVPVDELPPTRVVGFSVTEVREGGVTVSAADRVPP